MIIDVYLEAIVGRGAFLGGKTAVEIRQIAKQVDEIAQAVYDENESADAVAYIAAAMRASRKLEAFADAVDERSDTLYEIRAAYARAQVDAIQKALMLIS